MRIDDASAVPDPGLAEALSDIHAAAFAGIGRTWGGPEILALLREPGVGLRFAHLEVAGALAAAGFALYRVAADEAELLTVAVRPDARRAGVGSGLVAACEAGARQAAAARMFLEVAEDNHPARTLYAGAGYREVGRRKGYYLLPGGSRSDALVLEKRLRA